MYDHLQVVVGVVLCHRTVIPPSRESNPACRFIGLRLHCSLEEVSGRLNIGIERKGKAMTKKIVTGLFKNRSRAQVTVQALEKMGYTRDVVAVMSPRATGNKKFGIEGATQTLAGIGMGGAIGGLICALLAILFTAGTSLIFTDYDIAVAGQFAAALAGAGAGGFIGGLIGGFIGHNTPKYRTKVYEAGAEPGGTLLGVEARTRDEAKNLGTVLNDLGAEQVMYG